MKYILILLSILLAPPLEYEVSCVEGRSLERTSRGYEGRSFDGVRFQADNGTYTELFHPISITSRGSRIEFEDPFGASIKTSLSRIVGYTTMAEIFDFVSTCEDASQNKLTDSIIAGIKTQVLAPDLIIGGMGTISAPNFSTAEISNLGSTSLITKEYADANYAGGGGFFFADSPTVCGNIGGKDVIVDGAAFEPEDFTVTLNGNIYEWRLVTDIDNVGKTIIMERIRYYVTWDGIPGGAPQVIESNVLNRNVQGQIILSSDLPNSLANATLFGGSLFQWYTID